MVKLDTSAATRARVDSEGAALGDRVQAPPEEQVTTLLDIEVSIGAAGSATPFAQLEPVFVGG